MRRPWVRTLLPVVLALSLVAPFPALLGARQARAQEATPEAGAARQPVLLFAAPGMDQDLIDAFTAEGALPAFSAMKEGGAAGNLLAPFPATTGTILPTILTGAWPSEHGVVGDLFHRAGAEDFAEFARWDDAGIIQADTLPQAAERAGLQVAAVGWGGLLSLDPALNGPVVGEAVAYSRAGLLTTTALPNQPAAAEAHSLAYDVAEMRPAESWDSAPESFSPAQETDLTVQSLDAAGPNPDRTFPVYVFDSTDDSETNYDQVIVASAKDAASDAAPIGAGAWASLSVELAGEHAGEAAGLWLKVMALSPDLSDFQIYHTPISRYQASWAGCKELAACAEAEGFENLVNATIGPAVAIDVAPVNAGLIDPATFVAQATTSAWQAVDAVRLIGETLGVEPDLLLLSSSFPDAAARQFSALTRGEEGTATPVAPGSAADPDAALGSMRDAYSMADQLVAAGQQLLGPDAATLAATFDNVTATTMAVNAGRVLVDAGLVETDQPANCVPGTVTMPAGTPDPEALPAGPGAKACWSGGTAHVTVNLNGREAAGSVSEDDYDAARAEIVRAFSALVDPNNPDATVVASAVLKEDLRNVDGVDALHPNRTGDVVVTLAPLYRFDDPVAGEAIAEAAPLGVDGFSTAASDGTLYLAGPAIADGAAFDAAATDVAPTAAFLLRIPGPYNASGSILLDVVANGAALRELTILDISDFHGQLPPLGAAADSVGPSYDVGGVAVLAPWFERFREQASGPVLLVTAGDAVGATPPMSTAFGDTPTIEIMNALGFTADALGNHNFDAGAGYMFGTLAPLAEFPYLSVNLVPARADAATPMTGDAPFAPSLVIEEAGISVGLVGFSNPDIPLLTRPGALDPYRVIDPVEPINAEARRLREAGVDIVIAMGHMGATGGTLTEPTGPVVDVADQLQNVHVVVGDHTDVQVSAIRPNGVLLVENRSKGVMFTRITVVADSATGDVVYRTADHHRPWVIGMTPDAGIAEKLEVLQAELAPVLGTVIGAGAFPIPRADSCGMPTGRTCESLIGDVVTDAMRITYGTDFAITNSGGIRSDLTCPPEGGDFCPADASNQITEGQVLTVLPFGNVAVTLEVTGEELKSMLETGVGRMPEASGAFPQVSGLCFTYDIAAEPGNRVTSVVRQADDGSCSGEAIDLTADSTYTLTTNDFTASGGDGYPSLISRANSRDVLAPVVAGYVAGQSPLALPGEALAPELQGRIVCEGEGCPVPAGG